MTEPGRRGGSRLALLAWLAIAAACGGALERVRAHTYPPGFRYIPEAELESTMGRLAAHAHDLDHVVRDPELEPDERRARALLVLDAMQRAVDDLGAAGRRTNHPQLDANFERFRRDLALAKHGVEAEPPSYALAGSVSGACVYCHDGGG